MSEQLNSLELAIADFPREIRPKQVKFVKLLIDNHIRVEAYIESLVKYFILTRKKLKIEEEYSDSDAASNDSLHKYFIYTHVT